MQRAENINGREYQEAVGIYQQFLEDLDPEIMRVYAACTESPVDDEICARIRGIQQEIATEQRRSDQRGSEIAELERYVSGLDKLGDRWAAEVRRITADCEMEDDFRLQPLLSELRSGDLNPSQVWRRIRSAMILRATLVDETPILPWIPAKTDPLEASFLAAAQSISTEAISTEAIDPLEPTGVVLTKRPAANDTSPHHRFREFARCTDQSDALSVTSLLEAHDIRCFAHSDSIDHNANPPSLVASPELRIMVEADRFDEACRLVEHRWQASETAWTCGRCQSRVDPGYHRCWHCGASRGNE